MTVDSQHIRMAEALLFAAVEPLDEATLVKRLPDGADVPAILAELSERYRDRGIQLGKVAGRWAFYTAPDLAHLLQEHRQISRKLSRAAMETLAIIAYHQPITRAEVEDIRGVSLSKGTLDVLLETGWVRMRGRRRTPGRPVTYGTSDDFLIHFGLERVEDLPGMEDLKAAGLLEIQAPGSLALPKLGDEETAEDPLDAADEGADFLPDPTEAGEAEATAKKPAAKG